MNQVLTAFLNLAVPVFGEHLFEDHERHGHRPGEPDPLGQLSQQAPKIVGFAAHLALVELLRRNGVGPENRPRETGSHDGRALPGRSGEDVTSPEDTRAYRLGDPFKRIHWKLSIRARELIVRRFEIPEPPDTLILLDCTAPLGGEKTPDGKARLMDTLSETALSVAAMQMTDGQPVRLPFYGSRQSEFHADRQESLAMLKEELARQAYSGGVPFERVLNLELRRMRRTGATIVITTRLDAQVAEGVKNIRASGPNVRFYLITFTMNAPEYSPYIALLQQNLVEVCYVTPA